MTKLFKKIGEQFQQSSIRIVMLISFSAVSFIIVTTLSLSFFALYGKRTEEMIVSNTESLSQQEIINIESYLSRIRNVANALYYDAIKTSDLSSGKLQEKISLLYAANSNDLISIALFREDGTLLNVSPDSSMKPHVDITQQEWFTNALSEAENFHFSSPHVQNIFLSQNMSYSWVVSLSTSVDMVENGKTMRGVLLIDLNYQNLQHLLEECNASLEGQYSYLITADGDLIYHPLINQIQTNIAEENNIAAVKYQDGTHHETFENRNRIVISNTVSYTGWKLISVIPAETLQLTESSSKHLGIMFVSITLMIIILLNRILANRVSSPLIRLNHAIANTEGVRNISPAVYQNETQEIQELGTTLHSYISQINRLMDEMLEEEEDKRKSELDALQAQINPHFLYNTLDSIVWMIEGEKYEEAVYMITQLASFFRMSLNRGKSMISLENELQQARAYLNIQKIRYKQSFTDYYDIADDVKDAMIVKLVVQPILENAIYHGIKEAEQDGEIRIHAWREAEDAYISIQDNGFGMTQDEVESILIESKKPAVTKHGSGVGLINVDKRLRLRFGEQYGLQVQSELDEGTTVTIHLPYIQATQENLNLYENGKENRKNEEES